MLGLTSPVIYLVICLVIDRVSFASRKVRGYWPMSPDGYKLLFGIFVTLALVSLPLILVLKNRWAGTAGTENDEEETLFENQQTRRYVAIFMICDTVAVLGLILFLIQGNMTSMLLFGVLALLAYATAYPKPSHEPAD